MDRPSPRQGAVSGSMSWWRRPSAQGVAGAAAETGRYHATAALAVATCALAPAYTLRWHLGPIPTTLLENAILITVVVFAMECWRDRARPIWRTAVLIPALLFFVAGAISIVVAPDRRAALGLYRAYIVEPIAFGFVLINIISTTQRAVWIVAALAAGGTVAGLANSVVVLEALQHHTYDVVNTPPVVIYNTANAVALYLVPLTAFGGAVVLHRPDRRERFVAGAFLLISGLCVL